MPIQFTRRVAAVAALALLPLVGCTTPGESSAPVSATTTQTAAPVAFEQEFQQLEADFDARLGVYALDTGTDETVAYNADERFAYASTFKALIVGAVLQQNSVDEMEKVVTYSSEDLVPYSPITEQHVDTGMTLLEVSDAAIRYSDNTAANLLFHELGGPSGLGDALKGIGDDVTHVDRLEPDLNEATPGDIRDTSTPQALAGSLEEYTLGDTLPDDKRTILVDMLKGNTTGDELIRAGVPEGWEVGDKTGGGGYGTRNDIAVIWPPNDDPIILAVLSSRDEEDAEYDNALIAEATKVAIDALA
ncbi:class A beta-lactamase [Nocardiopsis ansamitocini]|uniref:Beta-lactamase n=1 Tax=Nocardiopsis ansamitocini TaxID=1670832 RepID=A0A9W6P4B2_9ACTN|nr:class A beta-lactamase [Nocardiopsis ansamitocini]GLU47069.1 beta-lactamase [Nocardiopsis ansamitocini]